MSDLLIAESQATVERALRDTILLAFGVRLPPVEDLDQLRASASRGAGTDYARGDDDLVYVAEKDCCYRWSTASTGEDDGDLVAKPADAGTTGRWLRQHSTQRYGGRFLHQIQTGVLVAVPLLYGAPSEDELQIFLGKRPSVGIIVLGDDPTAASDSPGAVYLTEFHFALWISSQNHRPDREAAVGSPMASDFEVDPGVDALDGALKKLLAGADLDVDGVRYVELGAGRVQLHDQAQRLFMRTREIVVKASESNPNDPADVSTVDEIDVQKQFVDLHGNRTFDEENFIGAGFAVDPGGLTTTVHGGSAVVGGLEIAVAGASRTFGTDSDTYRDLDDGGHWTFAAVPGDAPPPAVTTGALRVGVTRTRGGQIVDDELLACQRFDFGEPDVIPTT